MVVISQVMLRMCSLHRATWGAGRWHYGRAVTRKSPRRMIRITYNMASCEHAVRAPPAIGDRYRRRKSKFASSVSTTLMTMLVTIGT